MAREVEWTARQACGECGTDEAFKRYGASGLVLCHNCGHEHLQDPRHLDADEAFGFDAEGYLIVTAYAPNGDPL